MCFELEIQKSRDIDLWANLSIAEIRYESHNDQIVQLNAGSNRKIEDND